MECAFYKHRFIIRKFSNLISIYGTSTLKKEKLPKFFPGVVGTLAFWKQDVGKFVINIYLCLI